MENSRKGSIITTILCHDNDKDENNRQLSVSAKWWPEERHDSEMKHNVPFELVTEKLNSSEVSLYLYIYQ